MHFQHGSTSRSAALFEEAVALMVRLRAPGGCPWDREQTFDSIKPYTLEETYEVFEAIERRHWQDLCEELGDLLLQVLFYAEMASEEGHFSIAEVIAGLNRKLIRRHPHVFGDPESNGDALSPRSVAPAIDSEQVLRSWESIKQREKRDRPRPVSVLGEVPRSLPALMEARKLGSRAGKLGFDWPSIEGLFEKLQEEQLELREAVDKQTSDFRMRDDPSAAASQAVTSEVGDLLFTAVNLARHLKVDPEFALRHTNAKFRRRFAFMESAAASPLETLPAAELDSLWEMAKEAESPISATEP